MYHEPKSIEIISFRIICYSLIHPQFHLNFINLTARLVTMFSKKNRFHQISLSFSSTSGQLFILRYSCPTFTCASSIVLSLRVDIFHCCQEIVFQRNLVIFFDVIDDDMLIDNRRIDPVIVVVVVVLIACRNFFLSSTSFFSRFCGMYRSRQFFK